MKIIEVEFPFAKNLITTKPIVLVLGFFDGVHRGHQELLKKGQEIAQQQDLPLVVMTFDQHPRVIYAHDQHFKYLTTIAEKAQIMAQYGVDYLTVFKFNQELQTLPPERFVNEVIKQLNTKYVVAGFDYTYGPKDVANMQNLPRFAQGDFEVISVPKQTLANEKIGSTRIRTAIETGDLTTATALLGHPYTMTGKVVPGKQRGRQLGFRTANLAYLPDKVLPKVGVYATKLKVKGKWHEAMTSVGYNVTFNDEQQIFIETNIFDFDEDIYGQEITVAWYKYLRGEIKFNNVENLVKQLKQDETDVRNYFAQNPEN